jgi:hypothetical protein
VFRLVERQGSVIKVEAVSLPKRPFDAWLAEVGDPLCKP